MPAAKCYCRPQRESRPIWPCEDASTALKLCCLSATVYDVRCYWNTTTYQGELVDHSPGDVIGTDQNGEPLINCPETGYNTNLQGKAFFWFPDANATDQINPWRPCPQVCSESRLPEGIITNCATGIQVTWAYSCDTGLVTFNSTWVFEPGGQPPSFLTYPSVGIVTADPDWYLDNEIDIPYLTTGVNDNRPRFSVKLKMTCDAEEVCQPFLCFPLCVVNTCSDDPETVNASAVFVTASDGFDEYTGTATWSDVASEYTFSFPSGPCGDMTGRIYCDGASIKVDFGSPVVTATFTVDWTCVDGDVSYTTETEVFLPGGCAFYVTLWTNNSGAG